MSISYILLFFLLLLLLALVADPRQGDAEVETKVQQEEGEQKEECTDRRRSGYILIVGSKQRDFPPGHQSCRVSASHVGPELVAGLVALSRSWRWVLQKRKKTKMKRTRIFYQW